MSSSPVNKSVSSLFVELSKCEQNRDFEKALKVIQKILQIEENNLKALHCKIICQIHLELLEDALKSISTIPELCKTLLFEKAYCEYRLGKLNECMKTLESIKQPSFRENELKCQALYRLEKYQACYDLYLELIKNSEDEYEDERETNLAAVVVCLSRQNPKAVSNVDISDQTFELCYNKASIEINKGNYDLALTKLTQAEEMCRRTLEEEGLTDEEIQSELAIIKAQIGYANQMLGKTDIASRIYPQVLKQSSSDNALAAVLRNNIVTLNKDQAVFDSKKKMKLATTEASHPTLANYQRYTILYNNTLLLMQTNQLDSARTQFASLSATFSVEELGEPEKTKHALLEAALLVKEKKINEAGKVLERGGTEGILTKVGLLIGEGKKEEALKILEQIEDKYRLGILGLRMKLGGGVNVLKDAVEWYKKNKPAGRELLFLYNETAKHLMKENDYKEASNLLEALRKSDPNDPKVLALLITAYSAFDTNKAKEIMTHLPSINLPNIDVDALETCNWSLGAKYVKKTAKIEPSPGIEKKKKKKKRKKILPKNYDSSVDPNPERWLPRWQRQGFKKSRKDKRASFGKGTQGVISSNENEVISKGSPRPVGSSVNSSPNLRHQRLAQKKQKKKSTRR